MKGLEVETLNTEYHIYRFVDGVRLQVASATLVDEYQNNCFPFFSFTVTSLLLSYSPLLSCLTLMLKSSFIMEVEPEYDVALLVASLYIIGKFILRLVY